MSLPLVYSVFLLVGYSIFTDIPATGAFLSEVNQTQITQIAAIIAKEPKVPRVIMVDRIVEIKPADRWVDISGAD